MNEDLFGDGWRDPGDDGERMCAYIMFFLGLIAFAAAIVLGSILILTGRFPGETAQTAHAARGANIGLGIALLGIGLPGLAGTVFVLVKEAKRWDLKHLSAEKFIAGGFLVGIGCFALGGEMMQAGAQQGQDGIAPALVFFLLGAGILAVFLLLGLVIAFWPRLACRPRVLQSAYVIARYAVDDKLMEIPNHPCPRLDGWSAFVRLRTREGAQIELAAAESAYELAEPGSLGIATVRGRSLSAFKIQRRALG